MSQIFNLEAEVIIATTEELVERFTPLNYYIVLAMLLASLLIGIYGAWREGPQDTIRQILTADGQLNPPLTSTSLMASFICCSYVLGNAAEIHQHGTLYLYTMLAYVLVIPVTAHVFVPVFYNSGTLTIFEYLEKRFGRYIRLTTVGTYFLQMSVYIAIQLLAPALTLSKVNGMNLWGAVILIGAVCTLYTALGGIKAVVWTDSFQALCMVGAMVAVVAFGFSEVGGFAHAWEVARQGGRIRFDETSFNPTVRHSVWGLVIGGFFTNLASYAANQMMVLRYLTVSSETRAKMVVWGNLPLLAIIFTLSCLSGLMTFAYFSDCDPVKLGQIKSYDEILPYFVMTVLGKHRALPGIFAAGIFAASLSSISSAVNAVASVIFVDVISPFWPDVSSKTAARIITWLGVACGMSSILLVIPAEHVGDVLPATNAVVSGLGGPFLGLLIVAVCFPFVNAKGASLGFSVSLVISLWINVMSVINPLPIHPQLPVSVGKCMNTYMTVMESKSFVPLTQEEWIEPESLSIYQISYVWYTAISVLIVMVVAIPSGLLVGFNNPRKMNPKLAARPLDLIFWWLPKETRDWLAFDLGADYVGTGADEATSAKGSLKTVDGPDV